MASEQIRRKMKQFVMLAIIGILIFFIARFEAFPFPADSITKGPAAEKSSSVIYHPDGKLLASSVNGTQFSKRAIDWDKFVCKGQQLLDVMSTGQQESEWTEYSKLEDYGWELDGNNYPGVDLFGELKDNLDAAMFEDLGLSQDSSDWQMVDITHRNDYDVDGKTWEGSEAFYNSWFEFSETAIVVTSAYSPEYQLIRDGKDPKQDLPESLILKQWSDVTFLLWDKATQNRPGPRVNAPTWFIVESIINPDTKDVVSQALSNVGSSWDTLGDYPGHTFDMTTDEGKAILATPTGRGPAWFLGQHKQRFGQTSIYSASVWFEERHRPARKFLNILFAVEGGGREHGPWRG
ncbi:MAG: hypothetical protein M1820_004942 [Bogoriella megaspora]|nr:MAG: hypothetical protein M1820_004942 [Bogoriella megaspora]